ncbi:MAG: hypothetical protein IIY55_01590 [Blautia sp.]|nr:hypothetical protein [Blautia sp.]
MLDNLREKFARFMVGRYGADQLSRFTLIASLVLIILSMFFGGVPVLGSLINMLGLFGVVITYYRMFSRNIQKRYEENQKYLEYSRKVRERIGREQYLMEQRKTNHIYSCPGCGQKIRVPKGKGRIEISCPKCHTKFIKNS